MVCGKGLQIRSRICDSPQPASGGRPCVGPYTQALPCERGACAGDHFLPTYLSVCLSVGLSVSQSVCLPVYLHI